MKRLLGSLFTNGVNKAMMVRKAMKSSAKPMATRAGTIWLSKRTSKVAASPANMKGST